MRHPTPAASVPVPLVETHVQKLSWYSPQESHSCASSSSYVAPLSRHPRWERGTRRRGRHGRRREYSSRSRSRSLNPKRWGGQWEQAPFHSPPPPTCSSSLLLWYPTIILHRVNRSSPLFRFLYERFLIQQLQALKAGIEEEEEANHQDDEEEVTEEQQVDDKAKEKKKRGRKANRGGGGLQKKWRSVLLSSSSLLQAPPAPFQVVAVYEAVEPGTGALLQATKAYTPSAILQSYRFSSRLLTLRAPESSHQGRLYYDDSADNLLVRLWRSLKGSGRRGKRWQRLGPEELLLQGGRQQRGAVQVDYHYFNTMVPLHHEGE